MHSFRDLKVWQKSIDLVVEIYGLCKKLPVEEKFILASQIKRSSISIPSNIAEGRRRGTRKDYKHFIQIAYGSGGELETQLEVIMRLKITDKATIDLINVRLNEIMRMLNGLLIALSK